MFYIKDEYTFETIINKSRFIAILISVNDIEEVNKALISVKNKYMDANHYCYAYIIDSYSKCSDDSEPNGSAGMPILNVISKNNLNHIMCIVVRYFGGAKLGVGGLVRAYTNTTLGAIKKASLNTLEDALYVEILVSYDNIKKVELVLNKANILSKEFELDIKVCFNISGSNFDNIRYDLSLLSKILLIKNIKIKKDVD